MQIYCALEEEKKRNVSSTWYLFQIYELYFSINIDLVSNVNLEREGAKNKGLEAYEKTRIRKVCSWQQTLGLGLIHLGEILLGLSLLVMGRDWDFG